MVSVFMLVSVCSVSGEVDLECTYMYTSCSVSGEVDFELVIISS